MRYDPKSKKLHAIIAAAAFAFSLGGCSDFIMGEIDAAVMKECAKELSKVSDDTDAVAETCACMIPKVKTAAMSGHTKLDPEVIESALICAEDNGIDTGPLGSDDFAWALQSEEALKELAEEAAEEREMVEVYGLQEKDNADSESDSEY